MQHAGNLLKKSVDQLDTILWENISETAVEVEHQNISHAKAIMQEKKWPSVSFVHLEAIDSFVRENDNPKVRELYLYAIQRRSLQIHNATERFIRIAFTSRTERLSNIERIDCDMAFQAIYINICGTLDALSVLLNFYQNGGEIVQNPEINMTRKNFCKKLRLPELNALVAKHGEWLNHIQRTIRHNIVHRIPPYIPPCELTPDELEEHNRLENEKQLALGKKNFLAAKQYEKLQFQLARFFPYVAFTGLDGKVGKMDVCTVLNDVIIAQKLISECGIILSKLRSSQNQ